MSNIKLHPEESVFIPGKGLEKELAEILLEYEGILYKRGVITPFNLKAFSKFNKDFEQALDDAYDYIWEAANDGDIDAEHALRKINVLLDYDFPNYFVIQGEVDVNLNAAKFGDVYSQGMLGDKYYYGKGIEQNYDKAAYWFRISAEQGVALSQYNIAGCYELGRGVTKNKDKAIEWYRKAAKGGVNEAKRALKRIELEDSLSDEELLTYKPTYIWEGERDNSWKDEYGVEYSWDGKRLLDAPTDIKEYVIHDGVQVICQGAFCRCEKLMSVSIPESLIVIGGWAFKHCQALKTINLPSHLREIGESAFEYTKIKNVDIPESVLTIGDEAFSSCYDLETLTIPQNVENIGIRVIEWNMKLKTICVSPDNRHYDSRNNCNAIIETKSNTLIAGCGSTVIPTSITKIGDGAFFGCNGLTTIKIPKGVKTLERYCFFRCEKLKSVEIGEGVEYIRDHAFEECINLKEAKFAEGLSQIGDRAFKNCAALEECKLPQGLNSVGFSSFENCHKITSVVIPDSVKRIQENAFSDCNSVKYVYLPNSIRKIAGRTFCGCNNLSEIKIPDGVRIIGQSAFQYCKSLTSIVIPQSVELIEEAAFDDCDRIEVFLQRNNVEIEDDGNDDNKHNDTRSFEDFLREVRYKKGSKPVFILMN